MKKNQNRALQRKTINERTLKEIKALKISPKTGDLYCLDCNSKRIGYSSGDKSYTFDISDTEMQRNILEAIEDKISSYQEEIENYTFQINKLQRQMQELLKEEDINLEAVLLYKNSITSSTIDADTRIAEIDKEIRNLKDKQKISKQKSQYDQEKRDFLKKQIINTMNEFYRLIDPSGNVEFDDLFSKQLSVYSGCETTEFFLSKIYALAVVLRHRYPIMIDCFRDNELSTEKERVVLRKFGELSNQIIFTVTLKKEEMGKYFNYPQINVIDYSSHTNSHILSKNQVEKFKSLLFPIMI